MSIGSTLKLLRVASDLKQSSLAKDLDVTPNYLSLVENEKKEPSLTFLKKFSRRLNIPLGYFLWIALEDISLPEELDLKDKMDKLLVFILQQKRKDGSTSRNEKSQVQT
jgi:transcriptional regulator with XRE-family HTH domain